MNTIKLEWQGRLSRQKSPSFVPIFQFTLVRSDQFKKQEISLYIRRDAYTISSIVESINSYFFSLINKIFCSQNILLSRITLLLLIIIIIPEYTRNISNTREQRFVRQTRKRQNSRRSFGRLIGTNLEVGGGSGEKKRAITPSRRPARGIQRVSSKRQIVPTRQSFPRGTLSSPVSQLVSADAFLSAVWLLRVSRVSPPRRPLPR